MGINKVFETNGITITEDNCLPRGERTQRNVKRIIQAVRAAEGEFNDSINAANKLATESQEQVIQLMSENERLKDELRKFKVREAISTGGMAERLTTEDQKCLVGIAAE